MRAQVLLLVVGVAAAGCSRDGNGSPRKRDPAAETPSPGPTFDAADDTLDLDLTGLTVREPAAPLGKAPIGLTVDMDGAKDLEGEGLPALSVDGARLAIVVRSFVSEGKRRLRMLVLDASTGRQRKAFAIYNGVGAIPSDAELRKRMARANAFLDAASWRSLQRADVFPDGWIKCRDKQEFTVAGLRMVWDEPTLVITAEADGAMLLSKKFRRWLPRKRPRGCERSYISDAYVDLESRVLMVEVSHCGDCGLAPLRGVTTWGDGG